jgi:hypothetical protein
VLLGGACFWVPTMTIELATRHELNGILGTLVPPAVLFAVYLLLRSHIGLKNAAFWMLAGTYLLGPLFMMVGWTALGGGFASRLGGQNDATYLVFACVFPPLTLVLAGYDGTLFGLLLATLLMPLLQRWSNKRDTVTGSENRRGETATV